MENITRKDKESIMSIKFRPFTNSCVVPMFHLFVGDRFWLAVFVKLPAINVGIFGSSYWISSAGIAREF